MLLPSARTFVLCLALLSLTACGEKEVRSTEDLVQAASQGDEKAMTELEDRVREKLNISEETTSESDAAFDAPFARREFFVNTPPKMDSLTLQRFRSGYSKTKIDENKVKHAAIVFEPVIEVSKVSALDNDHPNTSVYALHMPESDLVATQVVKYTVVQDGVSKTYKVTDRIGVFSDAFELRIPGTEPTEVTAQRFASGLALGDALSL